MIVCMRIRLEMGKETVAKIYPEALQKRHTRLKQVHAELIALVQTSSSLTSKMDEAKNRFANSDARACAALFESKAVAGQDTTAMRRGFIYSQCIVDWGTAGYRSEEHLHPALYEYVMQHATKQTNHKAPS